MTFYVGVDGGGTRIRAVVVDEDGRELGRSERAGTVATIARADVAAECVILAVRTAAQEAGVPLPARALWAGLAGAGTPAVSDRVRLALEEAGLARHVHVGTDVEAAFQEAFPRGPGILLISGTGSVAWARDETGGTARVGGWGQHLGDEGSGYALGRAALTLLTRAADGRAPPTGLQEELLRHCGVETVSELVGWVDGASKAQVASLAPPVVQLADAGDEGAERLVDEALTALVELVTAAARRIGRAPGVVEVVPWGGLIAVSGPLHTRLADALRAEGFEVRPVALDPPLGAARLARASV